MVFSSPLSRRVALVFALGYLVIGIIWALFSHEVLLDREVTSLAWYQRYEDLGFLLATAAFLYGLIRFEIGRVERMARKAAVVRAHLDPLFAALPEALLVRDVAERRVVDANGATMSLFGCDHAAIVAMTATEQCHLVASGEPGFGEEDLYAHLRKALAEGRARAEWRCRRVDGTPFWAELNTFSYQAGERRFLAVLVRETSDVHAAQDARDQLLAELEERVRERTNALTAINQELETFTYAVSHDLKAPLRAVDGYTRLLDQDYGNRLDGEGQRLLANIRAAAERMNRLIEDLLRYSRLERSEIRMVSLQPGKVVAEIVDAFADEIQRGGVMVINEADALPLRADLSGVSIALRNVIGNALHHVVGRPNPTVTVRTQRLPGRCILTVEDNGVGFDSGYAEQIFEMFKQLRPNDGYGGSGVGLALVRKAMQRMGGSVRAEGRPGEGAKFSLAFPD
jgi:signal transduction histidine kinase